MGRTVNALPRLHPWRLGDTKGNTRTVRWAAAPSNVQGVSLFAQTAPEPELEVGDDDLPDGLLVPMLSLPKISSQMFSLKPPTVTRWLGGMTRLPGTWLPPLAILPRALRGFDDPGTRWSTESVDFAHRHSVHADNTRFAADVLAPHVMALILEKVPDGCAVTVAGDAIHAWMMYTDSVEQSPGRAQQLVMAAEQLGDAIPSFVTGDYPDRSNIVEADLAAKSDAAEAYRSHRTKGHSTDPTMQRIYDRAQAAWQAGHVSS